MSAFLKTLLLLTAAGTLCGLFLVALRKLSKGKILNSFLYFAWIIVVLRFAVPFNGLIPVGSLAPHADSPMPSYSEPQQVITDTEIMVLPSSYSHMHVPTQPVQSQPAAEQFTHGVKKAVFIPMLLFTVWCCGAAGFLIRNVISYARFAAWMRKGLSSPSRHDEELYDEVYSARKPTLRRSKIPSTPLTFGIVDPILVIPDTEYEDDALKHVFRHEIIHFRRHDILLKWLALFVFSAHWFNPFAWYFRKEIDRVCELSCDERLLKRMNADEKRRYGETLLKIAEDSCAAPCRMITGFSEGKKDLKERLIQIMSFKKKSKIAIAAAIVPILLLCGCAFALGPKADKAPEANTVTISNVDELLAAIAPNTEIRLAAGTYNLTEAASYGKGDASEHYHWENYGFGNQYELCIEGVDNLTIIGDNAEILTVPRSSNVLAFRNCDQLSLRGLTVGHTEAAEACEGGVIRLESCADAAIDNCWLYGCGTIGVWAEGSRNLKITNTEIYHCSCAGINFSNAAGLRVEDCSIYDCGKPEKYQSAAGAFSFFAVSDVSVKNCDVHDNYLQTLIQGSAKDVTFEGIRVHDNHISAAFCFDGDVEFGNLSFTGNTVDKWLDEYRSGSVTIDGKKYSEEELAEMWREQMSAAGIGATETEMAAIDRSGTKEVHVKTADEFLSAIASDTSVYIDVPRIDLTSASDYGEGAFDIWGTPDFGNNTCAWANCYDGYELWIGNISNFHIVGGEIVTQPRYANVLNYSSCSNVTLENVHLGHTPEQGSCRGGVLNLLASDGIILEGCDLYGCGILGIQAKNVRDLHVQNTLIHDCSNGAAMLEDSDNVVFLGCDVVNCPNPHFFLTGCDNFSWDNRLMDPFSSFNVNDNARNPYEEAQNSNVGFGDLPEAAIAANSAPPALTLHETAASFTCAYISQDVDIIRHFLSSDFEGDPKDVSPWNRIDMVKVKGADDETIDSSDGTKTVSVEFQNPDCPDSFVYLTIGLVKENDEWRVRWYGLEG